MADNFDFFDEEMIPGSKKSTSSSKSEISGSFGQLNTEKEATTSYLLVNALLNILIAKGYIYPHEVQSILSDLSHEYRKLKRKGEEE